MSVKSAMDAYVAADIRWISCGSRDAAEMDRLAKAKNHMKRNGWCWIPIAGYFLYWTMPV